ncbi:MAG: hypothetical protein ACLUNQ_06795 [Oscillospiraceae bacterium]
MGERCTVEGTVQSVVFQNEENGYTVLSLLTEQGEVVTVVGCIPYAAPGEGMTVTGVWITHPLYGPQITCEQVERRMPREEEEIVSYLASGILKGVGRGHGGAAGGAIRHGHAPGAGGGAGAAQPNKGHHSQKGHGTIQGISGIDGPAADHGVYGPV